MKVGSWVVAHFCSWQNLSLDSHLIFFFFLFHLACCPCPRTGAPDCLHAGCGTSSRAEADAGLVLAFCCFAIIFSIVYTIHLIFLHFHSIHSCYSFPRWASVPPDSEHAPQPGRQDHRHAAGDWQLWATSHARVTWVTALKGQFARLWKTHGEKIFPLWILADLNDWMLIDNVM